MPVVPSSSYHAPFLLPGGHAQTVAPVFLRRSFPGMETLGLRRQSLETPDGDFFDVDFSFSGGNQRGILLVSHGLEGHSRRPYMLGMCLTARRLGLDCALRNFRGCGGRMNRLPFFYHSGQTDDIHTLVEYCLGLGYRRIYLAGFSLGGNQTLKYLGENPARVPAAVAGAVAFSTPVDLTAGARVLDKTINTPYMWYFMAGLREKVRAKHHMYPDLYPLRGLEKITSFAEFDDRYTAPLNGFSSAADYWRRASSLPHLEHIAVPTLLVNARNDPFLAEECFPEEQAGASSFLYLECPEEGGHLGFIRDFRGPLWSENRTEEFFGSLAA